jgi:hypothetical protein
MNRNTAKFLTLSGLSAAIGLGAVANFLASRPEDPSPAVRSLGSAALVEQTMREGDRIIRAIESYRADKGHPPSSLLALVPDYLPSIDPPAAGSPAWQYESRGIEDWTLAFGVDFGPGLYPKIWRSSRDPSWQSDF